MKAEGERVTAQNKGQGVTGERWARPPLSVKCLVQIAPKCTQLETGCFMILSVSLLLSAFKSIDRFKLMKVLLSKGAFIVRQWQTGYLPFTLPKWTCLENGSLREFPHGQSSREEVV